MTVTTPPAESSTRRSPRTRFFVACAIGGFLATVVFAWLLLEGRSDLLAPDLFTNFYEAQARAWLDGRWDVPANVLFFERFNVDGKFYMYHGPFPALVRLPVVAVTHSLDGQMSRVSMLLAFGVLMIGTSRLLWQARTLVRGDGPPSRRGLVAAAAFVFVVGCGSPAFFLGSFAWVHHEALLWGVALSVLSFSFLAGYLMTSGRVTLALASVTAMFAFLARGSVGLGPVAGIAVLFSIRAARRAVEVRRRRSDAAGSASNPDPWWQRALGTGTPSDPRLWPLALAAALPLVSYAAVNYAKFRTFFGAPPVKLQDLILRQPQRAAALAANNGSLFGLKYAPTNLLHYLRPDGLVLERLFPWVDDAESPTIIGGVVYDRIEGAASVPAITTFLLVLAIVGVAAVVRSPRVSGTSIGAAALRVPVLGALLGCVGILTIAFISQRYEADFVPLLVILGSAGLWWVARLVSVRSRRVRRLAVAVLALLAAWSCWGQISLAIRHQRTQSFFATMQTRARFVDFQLDVYERIPGGGAPSRVGRGDRLPRRAENGDLFILGDCEQTLVSDGTDWSAIEQSPAAGRARYRVRFPDAPDGTREPLFATGGRNDGTSTLWVRFVGPDEIAFEYETTAEPAKVRNVTVSSDFIGPGLTSPYAEVPVSLPVHLPRNRVLDLTVRFDRLGYVSVFNGNRAVLAVNDPVAAGPLVAGRAPNRPSLRFTGTVRARPTPTPLCDRLLRLERESAAR